MAGLAGNQEFTIRAATVEDIAVLARHRCEMFKDMGQLREEHYRDLAEASMSYFAQSIPAGEYVAWVAAPTERPELIVAGGGMQLRRVLPRPTRTGELQEPGPQGVILNVYTEKEWRRTGLGELVMRTIIEWSRANGVASLVLHASSMGRSLYERLGFLDSNEMYYPIQVKSPEDEQGERTATEPSVRAAGRERPPVMFIPGTIAPADFTYSTLLEVIGEEIEPILKDLEVYAGDAPPQGYTLETEVEGIKGAADDRGLGSFHLVGHSIGGAAALAFAAEYPERVRSLALIEPGSIARVDSTAEEAAETDRILALPPEERLKEYSRLLVGEGVEGPRGALLDSPPPWMAKRPAGIEATSRALRAYKLDWERFRSFRQPVYLARGSLSHPRWERQATRLAGLFPNIRVEVYEGRSHIDAPHRAEPERFAGALRELWAVG